MNGEKQIRNALWILLVTSLLIRAMIAAFLELGNDEVYYRTYALFPDWSHFDHPPMVGWLIQLFTLNLFFDSEFFLRLASLVFGTINTWMVFRIGKKIKDGLTGLYAAFLFTASFYCFVISGTFIMPDTPQVFFWLLSLYLLLECLPDRNLTGRSRYFLLLAGLTTGLALLSKYHSVFLILGVFLYMLVYNRKWFRAKETYLAFLLAMILFLPVVIWNYRNDFISFSYQESRIGPTHHGIRCDFFITEMAGQVFYNNPVNFILIVSSLVAWIAGRRFIGKESFRFLILTSLPLSLLFLVFSLFDATLPHWTGPAYLGFILIAASWLSSIQDLRTKKKILPWGIRISLSLMLIFVVLAFGQIRYGWIPFRKTGAADITAELYGWQQLGARFREIAKTDEEEGLMDPSSPLVTFRWFPAAHFDYYVAGPIQKKVYAWGTLEQIHKYYWIDRERGNIPEGTDLYYLVMKDDYGSPYDLYGRLFTAISPPDTLFITRGRDTIREAYVYRLLGLKKEIRFNRITDFIQPSPERIHHWKIQILTHPDWYRKTVMKSRRQNRPLEDVLWEEAVWAAEFEMRQ